MKILPLVLVAAGLVCGVIARAQEEDGRARGGLLKRGLLAKGKATTTTTTAAPQEEAEYEEEYADEGEGQEPSTEAPPSSTEGKKLVAGGVRPFRSNTDLLEALKRRRAQAAEAKLHGHQTAAAAAPAPQDAAAEPAPSKAAYNKKRYNNTPKETQNEEALAPAPVKPSRGRFGRPASSKSIQEDHEEQNESAPAPIRTGRTFLRRGSN